MDQVEYFEVLNRAKDILLQCTDYKRYIKIEETANHIFVIVDLVHPEINLLSNLVQSDISYSKPIEHKIEEEKMVISTSNLRDAIDEFIESKETDKAQTVNYINCYIVPILNDMLSYRTNLSILLTDERFVLFLNDHLKEIKNILCNIDILKEGNDDSPIDFSYLTIPLSPYEQRVLRIKEYAQSYLDSIEPYEEIKLRQRKCVNEEEIFKFPQLHKDIMFLDIRDIIDLLFFTEHRNMIFIPMNSNIAGMEHSFYILESIKDGTKYWKMVAHLDEIVKILSVKMLQFGTELISSFIKDWKGELVYDSSIKFSWNLSEKEYNNVPMRWYQYFRVWKNLFVAEDTYILGDILRKKCMEKATYYIGTSDRISNIDDDKILHKKYKTYKDRLKINLTPFEEEPINFLEDIFTNLDEWNYTASCKSYRNRYKGR